jgi:hypothetical protein
MTEVKIIIKMMVVLRTSPSFFVYFVSWVKLTLEKRTKGMAPLTKPLKKSI